jgi:hypothetical protein
LKHQYFGDVNDYRKYGLLRLLATDGGLRLGICWMLTPDDDSRHGGKINYLDQPRRWRPYDPDLFDHLAASVKSARARDLGVVEARDLIPGAHYHSEILEDGVVAREEYLRTMIDRFKGLDLVFFDPDNGLDVKGCPPGQKRSSKYLTCQEAAATFATGTSLLIYQHYPHVEKDAYVREQVQRLADSSGAKDIFPISTAHVLFLLVLHPDHIPAAQCALEALDRKWLGQFRRQAPWAGEWQ